MDGPISKPSAGSEYVSVSLCRRQQAGGEQGTRWQSADEPCDRAGRCGLLRQLKNTSLLRLPQPTNFDPNQNVISVGVVSSSKSIFALAFNGRQLYAGASNGFYVFGANSDITQCSGNANNCGTPKLLMGGTSVNGVAADGLGHVYFVGSSGVLNRYNVSARTFTRADSGLIIEAGHTSTLGFDKDGNLWLGEQPVADLPNGGRVRVYLAADLARLP